MTQINFTATGSTLAEVQRAAFDIAVAFFGSEALEVRVGRATWSEDASTWVGECWALPIADMRGVVVDGLWYAHERFVPGGAPKEQQ